MAWFTDKDGKEFVEVDGLGVFPVLANDPTPSALNDRRGNPVVWPSVRRLRLDQDDNLVVYACADCSYVNKSANSIRPHRNKHRKQDPEVTELVRATLRTALSAAAPDQSTKIEKLAADLAEWKRRALTAEQQLSALRQAWQRVTGS
jgi:hypothetical protein